MIADNARLAAATDRQNMIGRRPNTRRKVCVLAYNGLSAFEYGIAVEVFFSKNLQLDNWYEFQVIAIDPVPIQGTGHITIDASTNLQALLDADLIIVPGWRGIDENISDSLRDTLIAAHHKGVKIASICSGVFVLAQCGLLDGKRATTHWQFIDELSSRYPHIKVDKNIAFVEEGTLITSGGSTAGIDMCLYIVKGDYGAKIASIIGRRLNVETKNETGEAIAGAQTHMPHMYQGNIAPLLDRIRASINEEWGIERMADATRTSARTLQRRFKDSTGHSPHMWLTIERVELAKDLLETSNMNIQQIATATGLKTPETFRHHFKRLTGTSPTKFRAGFS